MSSLDNLKKRIYKPGEEFSERERKEPVFAKERKDAKDIWESPDFHNPEEILISSKDYLIKMKQRKRKRNKMFIIFSVVFLIAAAGIFAYSFFIRGGGIGFLSSQNIDIKIGGASSVNAGEKLLLPVIIKNNNKVALQNVGIIVEYPQGSEIINRENDFSLKEKRNVSEILPGRESEELFEAFIFGEENSSELVKVSVEYRLADSSAIFEKSAERKIEIAKPAASIFIEAPEAASFGKEINFKIDAISNTDFELKNMVLDVEYPDGFEFIEADPSPQENKSRFILGNILSGEKKTISIKGKLGIKNFAPEEFIKASIGGLNDKDETTIYSRKTFSLAVKKPFLDIAFKIGKESGNYISRPNDTLNFTLNWENNLPIGVKNAKLEARLESGGEIIDLSTLKIKNGGTYRSFDNTIVWDSVNYPKFSYIESGEKGSVEFSVKVKDPSAFTNGQNKNANASFAAKLFTSYLPEEFKDIDISGNDKILVKLVSDFQFAQYGFYSLGSFSNTGPIPPKVGNETTYTIKWSLVNSLNDLSNVSVSAVLPNYVKWLNNARSETNLGEISYNEESREVKWTINALRARTGISFPAEEISFQILFLPSETQIKSSPILIGKAVARGFDGFVNANLEDSQPAVTTSLINDPKVGRGGGTVVR